MKTRKESTYRFIAIVVIVVSLFSSCATRKVHVNIEQGVVAEAPPLNVEEQKETVEVLGDSASSENEEKARNSNLPSVKAFDADSALWSSIVAQAKRNEKPEIEDTAEPIGKLEENDEREAVVEHEEPEPIQGESEEKEVENASEEKEEPSEVEENSIEEETTESNLPIIEIKDEPLKEESNVIIFSDGDGDDITLNESSYDSAIAKEEISNTILKGDTSDLESIAPSWLYSEKEKEKEGEKSFSPVINIYEIKEEEEKDDGVKPEDILAFSETYRADREDKKKIGELKETDIVTGLTKILKKASPYILAVILSCVVFIIGRILLKHIKTDKKKESKEVEGVEFNPSTITEFEYDPMENTTINDVDKVKEEEKNNEITGNENTPINSINNENEHKKETVEVPKENNFKEKYYVDDGDDFLAIGEEECDENVALEQATAVINDIWGVTI